MSNLDPITGICIVDKKSSCPPGYVLIDKTAEEEDADLWKDGIFRSKVTRYICYTKSVATAQWNHIVTNVIIVGAKDPVPAGYNPIRVTMDTKEPALKKHILCVQLLPKSVTNAGVTDLKLMRSDRYKMEQYTNVGDVNGLHIVYKLTQLPQRTVSAPSRPAPLPPPTKETVTPLAAPPPIPQRPRQNSAPTADNKHDPLAAISGIEFKLHERLMQTNPNARKQDDLNITIKSQTELDELFDYDFSVERNTLMQ